MREQKWLLGVLLLVLAACNGTTAAWKTYVDPTSDPLTFHFSYPSDWSLESRGSDLVLTTPEPPIKILISSHPAGHETVEACAAMLFTREGGDFTMTPVHFVSMNSDIITLEDTLPVTHFVACFETRTRLPYPLVTIVVTAPLPAFYSHREDLRNLVESLRFRPTF
jgi:hypothetical protein